MLSTLPVVSSCVYSFWHGVIPTSYLILTDNNTDVVTIKWCATKRESAVADLDLAF